jgi:hypothetical protein
MHGVIRGIVQDRTTYRDECFKAGLGGSKGDFRTCFWEMRMRHSPGFKQGLWRDGPPRDAALPTQRPNLASGARYRVYMSNEGAINNGFQWPGPNHYQEGDLLLHFAGPNKTKLPEYLARAIARCEVEESA